MYLNSLNKKVRITFIRHGTTKFNEEDRVQGSSDIDLSQKGINEINDINISNFNYDMFIHSPLSRSKDTLYGILNKYNKNINDINLREDILITERKYGIFEGLTKDEIKKKYPELYKEWLVNENIQGDGIESIENVIDRIKLFISKIISFNFYNILVVTHSGFLYALYKYISGCDISLKPNDIDVNFSNCSITCLDIDIIYDKMEIILHVNEKEIKKTINF